MEREVRLFLFRHGETDWNAEGRFQGHLDVPLNDRGREQARALGARLREQRIELIVASDLGRAVETAQIVAGELGLDPSQVIQNPSLREAFLGEAQGLTLEEIRERFGGELLQRWRSNHVSDADISYPGGETGAQVQERAMRAIRELADRHAPFTRIGISTHGGVIRRFMHRLLQLAGTPAAEPIPIPNGVVYEIAYSPAQARWKVIR